MSFTDPTQSDWWMQICSNRSQVQKQNISQDSSSMRSRMQKCLIVCATEGIWKKIMFKDNIFILVMSLKRIGNGKSSFYADSASHPSTARNRNKSQKVPPKPFGNYFHNIKAEAVGIAHIHKQIKTTDKLCVARTTWHWTFLFYVSCQKEQETQYQIETISMIQECCRKIPLSDINWSPDSTSSLARKVPLPLFSLPNFSHKFCFYEIYRRQKKSNFLDPKNMCVTDRLMKPRRKVHNLIERKRICQTWTGNKGNKLLVLIERV